MSLHRYTVFFGGKGVPNDPGVGRFEKGWYRSPIRWSSGSGAHQFFGERKWKSAMGQLVNEVGSRYGRLVVLRRAGVIAGAAAWLCRCDCGEKKVVAGTALRAGVIRSCGCLLDDYRRTHREHGHNRREHQSPTYTSWRAMLDRVRYAELYPTYVAVRVCSTLQSFVGFLKVLGPRKSGTSLGRRADFSNYSCGRLHCRDCREHGWRKNCRWMTRAEQTLAQRQKRILNGKV